MIRKDPVSRAMLGAIMLSSVGVGIHLLALGQLLYLHTGSSEAFAFVLTLQGVAAICVLPLCGPLVDALSSRWVYVGCAVGRATSVLAIVLFSVAPLDEPLPFILGAAVLLAIFDNVERSALFKFTAHHINGDHVVKFNSMIGVAFQAGVLSGMAVLGVILVWGTPSQALSVDVVMALLCGFIVARIRLTTHEGASRLSLPVLRKSVVGVVGEWRGMLRQYRHEAVVVVMIGICAADFVFAHSLSTLVIPLVNDVYNEQTWYISALEATFAVGMISASFFTSRLVRQRLLPLWLLLQGGAALMLATSLGGQSPVVHFAAFFIGGFANLNSLTWLLTSLQQHAFQDDKGKMASLRLLAIGIGTAALMPVVGRAASVTLTVGFVTISVIMVVFAVAAVWVAHSFRPRPTDAITETGTPTPETDQAGLEAATPNGAVPPAASPMPNSPVN